MEPPVTVDLPGFRLDTARILAYWSDRGIQNREWIQRNRVEPFWDTLWEQIADMDGYVGTPPPIEERIGGVLASPDEARRLQATVDRLDAILDLDEVFTNKPETYFDHPLWHAVNRLSQASLNLIVMTGGCWIDDEQIVIDEAHLVYQYPLRGLAARCLASLADDGSSDLDENPPLRRDFDDATSILVNQCSLANPRAAIDRIYRDGDEIPRLERLHGAIQAAEPHEQIAALAGHALAAIVRAWSGWNYDGPVDAGRH